MATAKVQVPPSNYIAPGSHHLSPVSYPKSSTTTPPDARETAIAWVSSFNDLIQSGDAIAPDVFLEESHWRDLLCSTWDFHTLSGPEKIATFIQDQHNRSHIQSLSVDTSTDLRQPTVAAVDFGGSVKGVQAFVTVDTDVGRGRGLVRLLSDAKDGGKWKAFTLFTTLEELKGYEELVKDRRPTGVEHGAQPDRRNWKDRRTAAENFEGDIQPAVIIIGAGQGGLTTAARLKQLGVESLIVDQVANVGDNWRNRYHQLVLHDSVWYDHMPYLPFPPHWPVFTPKDKLAEWFQLYAKALELNVWTSTTLINSSFDFQKKKWTVTLEREKDGIKEERKLYPRHVIQATGHAGEAYFPKDIKGLDDFKGDLLIHSSQFKGPQPNGEGKKAVIVGSCNSAHDIARDYLDHGYDVTMVQRSSTLVLTSETLIEVTMKGIYSEDGPPLEDADLLNMSFPAPVAKRHQADATVAMLARDSALLSRLSAAGFALDSGPDASGLFMKYLHRGGGYYIDVGTSSLIASGAIKIKQGQEIARVDPHGLTFADDTSLLADELVFATGFQNMRETARKIFGDELAEKVTDVWGFDEEGETRGMWRPTGHPGFWFMGGNLALCRFYSRLLALQIKALEEGVNQEGK
ncbi:MAG: hypothetical protein M1833_000990 [Piccolia ochrophora]|nr:MAG: hypothetical protein M1833_000990 [Piccolia ochrophora]